MNKTQKILAVVFVIGILIAPLAIASSPKDADKIKEKYEQNILSIAGVTGDYADKESNTIGVLVEDNTAAQKVPKSIEGIPVTVTVTGKIRAYSSSTATQLPLIGGISLGSAAIYCSSGTLGDVTSNIGSNGKPYILSNAHVLALNYNVNFVPIGSNPTWQAGGADTNCGTPGSYNVVGNLANYIPITFNNKRAINHADAAIASIDPSITSSQYLQSTGLDTSTGGSYKVYGMTTVSGGDTVRKSGRTTGVTTGTVTSSSTTVKVCYNQFCSKWAIYQDQIYVSGSGFSAPGDSGSVVDKPDSLSVADSNGQWAGLLFAGSSSSTIISKAGYIAASPTGIGSNNIGGGLGVSI